MQRRALLAGVSGLLAATSGCIALGSSTRPAHTVSVYLADREATRDVTVIVRNANEQTLFDREYRLSDGNEAAEDETFPADTDPDTVVVTVDGTRFEREWPGFEEPSMPCEGENSAGIEVWVQGDPDESPVVRLEGNCQNVTVE